MLSFYVKFSNLSQSLREENHRLPISDQWLHNSMKNILIQLLNMMKFCT